MAEALVTWCDLCLPHGQHTYADHLGVTFEVGAAEPAALDLCDDHYHQLVKPLVELLARCGWDPRPPEPEPRQHRWGWKRHVGPFLCQAGCGAAPHKSAFTLEAHLKKLHGLTLDDYVEQYGPLEPLTDEQLEALVVEVACQIEGCGKVYSTALGNRYPQQAMVSHLWGHHAIKWAPGQPLPVREERT